MRKRTELYKVVMASSGNIYPWYIVANSIEHALQIAREEKSQWVIIESIQYMHSVVIDEEEDGS